MNIRHFKELNKKIGGIYHRSSYPTYQADKVFEKYLGGKKYNVILEIGTFNGITANILKQYCNKVVTIDIVDNRERVKDDKVEFVLIGSESEKEEYISGLHFDFCYMDGAHCNYTYSDWMMVRKCGKVLFHEYWEEQMPVFDLVNSLPEDEVDKYFYEKDIVPYAYWERK